MKRMPIGLFGALLLTALFFESTSGDVITPVPKDQRGRIDAERMGTHDANNIRTRFWNYGMVGDYPADPGNVDLSIFHSAEVPKGTGMNYSDGITPFVLARIIQGNGIPAYIMETGFRERQASSPFFNRDMRFEPRPGYFQPDPNINAARSPAISNDPRTWPEFWPDKLDDPDDPGWPGSWNGYFGKREDVADQETYMVLDDDLYDAWNFYPDSRDSTRRGLGLRIELRGFQWANPQARNVIFWHYDITNEGTTDYDDNIIFGLYMDSGVGGSALSCDGIFESDDDNAFFDRTFDENVINLVYTWDRFNHGKDLTSSCGRTGYLGYAYLETPGNALDGIDNDEDGFTDELRDGGPGMLIEGQDAIMTYLQTNYDIERFVANYGPIEDRPAYRAEMWWTGDEDMDWTAELHDLGVDGLAETDDTGEGDGIPTEGEPNFDGTDLNESDQIGLTGFKINRIRAGQGNPNQEIDDIVFFTNANEWPQRLYEQFSDPDSTVRFGEALGSNYNIGFLFASGPFKLPAGKTERFSLALAYGADLDGLRRTVRTVQQIYNANYRFAVPPPTPTLTAEAGDGFVRLSWDDVAERGADPVSGMFDFEGYRIYRSTDPAFLDPQVIVSGTGTEPIGIGRPISQFDIIDERQGFSLQSVEGVAYFLGTDSGLTHTWTDFSVTNGQEYYYGVTAYDFGADQNPDGFYPSENSVSVSRTLLGGTVFPPNVVAVRPNVRVAGYQPAATTDITQIAGRGTGTVLIDVVNSELVPENHVFKITFSTPAPDSILAATYALSDSTTGDLFYETGRDLIGQGIGPAGAGCLPIITSQEFTTVDEESTGFTAGSPTDASLVAAYQQGLFADQNFARVGYPDDITVIFHDVVVDTSLNGGVGWPARAVKYEIIAHTLDGDKRLDSRLDDDDGDGTLSLLSERLDIATYDARDPTGTKYYSWRLRFDPDGPAPGQPLGEGDVFELRLIRPLSNEDVFIFTSRGQYIDPSQARQDFKPYVVPNPYVGSASFEPERYGVSGRGERRIEFRGLPAQCTIRIYTVRGELVQTLRHDGSNDGIVAWNLRTKDSLDVAPGLYIYHVDGGRTGSTTGKFALIK